MTRQRRWGVAVVAALASVSIVVVAHDAVRSASLSIDLLCQRPDGSLWRDPSQGCTGGEDPRCTTGTGCTDSTILSEGWRHACTWLLFDEEIAPRGEEPFHVGPSPGGGCPGRS